MVTYPSQASPIDNDNHPVDSGLEATNDHWGTRLAGDVVSGDFPQSGLGGAANQIRNQGAMRDIATKGPKVVDPSNLKIFPKK